MVGAADQGPLDGRERDPGQHPPEEVAVRADAIVPARASSDPPLHRQLETASFGVAWIVVQSRDLEAVDRQEALLDLSPWLLAKSLEDVDADNPLDSRHVSGEGEDLAEEDGLAEREVIGVEEAQSPIRQCTCTEGSMSAFCTTAR